MAWRIKSMELKPTKNNTGGGKVLIKLENIDSWGRIDRRQQFTVSRRNLEKALRDAELVVPWERLFR